jgi:hypothetical protein
LKKSFELKKNYFENFKNYFIFNLIS